MGRTLHSVKVARETLAFLMTVSLHGFHLSLFKIELFFRQIHTLMFVLAPFVAKVYLNSTIEVFFRLSIASAHAFLLVYSVTDPLSFVTVKHRFEEIREQRADFQVSLGRLSMSLIVLE